MSYIKKKNLWHLLIFFIFCLFIMGNSGVLAAGDSLRFAVISDTQGSSAQNPVNEAVFSGIVSQILKLNPRPALVVITGDLVHSGGTEQYMKWNKIAAPLIDSGIKIYPVIGNHHLYIGPAAGQRDYQKNFNLPANGPGGYKELAYYFNAGPALFVVLDAFYFDGKQVVSNQFGPTQTNWLRQVLKSSNRPFKFIFAHPPAFSTGAHLGSSLDAYPEERDTFWKILENNNVDVYFCGHEHLYSRWNIDSKVNPTFTKSVLQITCGGSGGGLVQPGPAAQSDFIKSIHHFVIVDLNAGSLKLTAYNDNGQVFDRFIKTK